MNRTVTCIICPKGCNINVSGGEDCLQISGNQCRRGEEYAKNEVLSPARTVTTTVKITGAAARLLPVRSKTPAPKDKIFDIVRALNDITVPAPVKVGDVIVSNVCGTGVDIVASRSVEALK